MLFHRVKLTMWVNGPANISFRYLHVTCIKGSSHNYLKDEYQYLHKSKVPTMHFQKSLLRLPIPDIEKTCHRYLRAQEAILSKEEFNFTERVVGEFKTGIGADLHAQLKLNDKANKHTSYISKPWFDMYLTDRSPIVLNYNPFLAFMKDERPGYDDPVLRATNILVSSLRFMKSLRESLLEPEVYHMNPSKSDTQKFRNMVKWIPSSFASYAAYAYKAFPLDMSQFGNLFNSTRIPQMGQDVLLSNQNARHMLVMKSGHFYVFDIFDVDGNILSPAHIHACLLYIAKDDIHPPSHPLGILTSENRDKWANVRQMLVEAGNEEALNDIDSAAFNIIFDSHTMDADPVKMYKTFLHGDGNNRWFDKSFSLIFTNDGEVALNFEHSWGDGVAIMRYFNEVAKDSVESGLVHPSSRPASIDESQHVRRLDFSLTPSIKSKIESAKKNFDAVVSPLAVHVLESDILGKDLCKKYQVSPDAMMQLGFQTAYYLQEGAIAATYESCSTSAFKHGRTETVRPATVQTTKFSKSVSSLNPMNNSELKHLILECSKVHGNLTKEAAMGQGFDRHLYGMRKLAEGSSISLPALYLDPAYAKINHNILSTSTLPSNRISFGGFAPVVRDGFGVGYQIQDEKLGIVLSSYPPHRDGSGFISCAEKAYSIIRNILVK